jgi:non-reducing end alpha-L-arabinofuranosidase
MENLMYACGPRRLVGRLAVAGLLGAALATFGFVGTAVADTINYTGQGTTNGACGQFIDDPSVPAGKQVWQFNLTQTQSGATMSASFSDGTTVTNKAEDNHTGKVSKWFIQTDLGATVTSASASFTPDGPNSQFTVSHCTASGVPPTTGPPPTTTPPTTTPPTTASPPPGGGGIEVGGVTASRPNAAVAVVAQPQFTG